MKINQMMTFPVTNEPTLEPQYHEVQNILQYLFHHLNHPEMLFHLKDLITMTYSLFLSGDSSSMDTSSSFTLFCSSLVVLYCSSFIMFVVYCHCCHFIAVHSCSFFMIAIICINGVLRISIPVTLVSISFCCVSCVI